jgi:hypothetical protein
VIEEMLCKVDWLAFTIPMPSPTDGAGGETMAHIHKIITSYFGSCWPPVARPENWKLEQGRGFYTCRVFDDESKIRLSWGNVNAHVYVEFGGQSCDYVRATTGWYDLLEKVRTRTSRIDFAVDIECDIKPHDFIVNNDREAFKTTGFIKSENGETVYVGSRKSERMVRVYRYFIPHPRSHLLRCEAEYKGDAAKAGVAAVLLRGETQACLDAHFPFQWVHPVWKVDLARASPIAAKRSDREGISTLRWLTAAVAPSLVKAHRSGLLDVHAWFAQEVLKNIK